MCDRMTAPRRHQVVLRLRGSVTVGAWGAVPGDGVLVVFLFFLTTSFALVCMDCELIEKLH